MFNSLLRVLITPLVQAGKSCIRGILSLSPAGRRYYAERKKRQRMETLQRVQTYGGEILSKIHAILTREKIDYIIEGGTLLGCVRDGGIMPHDDDIDIALPPFPPISARRIVELLEKEGFAFFWAWKYNGRITEFSVSYKGVHIDFSFLHDAGTHFESHWYMPISGIKYPNKRTWSGLSTNRPKIKGLQPLHVNKYEIDVMIPSNYDEWLKSCYGNWRTPDPSWKSKIDPNNLPKEGSRRLLPDFAVMISRKDL